MNPVTSVSRLLKFAAVFLGAVLLASAAPTNVLIRVPAGTPSPAELPGLLSKWRQSGQVSNVLFLTQGKAEKPEHPANFESLVVLEFQSEGSYQSWQKECAPTLPAGLIVHQADALAHNEISPRDSNHSVFVVNAYTPTVSAEKFADYVHGYVAPLYEAMRGTKHLIRYTAYLERGETGKADAINVLEYRDQGPSVAFHHTVTVPNQRGHGYAAKLVEFAVDDVERSGRRITPSCWYVAEWFDQHPERAGALAR